jgi:hypothetical protein
MTFITLMGLVESEIFYIAWLRTDHHHPSFSQAFALIFSYTSAF